MDSDECGLFPAMCSLFFERDLYNSENSFVVFDFSDLKGLYLVPGKYVQGFLTIYLTVNGNIHLKYNRPQYLTELFKVKIHCPFQACVSVLLRIF